jgi:hypothetical protein
MTRETISMPSIGLSLDNYIKLDALTVIDCLPALHACLGSIPNSDYYRFCLRLGELKPRRKTNVHGVSAIMRNRMGKSVESNKL